MISFGDNYFVKLSYVTGHPFWKEVFEGMSLLVKACKKVWLSESLWINSSIQIGKESIFF